MTSSGRVKFDVADKSSRLSGFIRCRCFVIRKNRQRMKANSEWLEGLVLMLVWGAGEVRAKKQSTPAFRGIVGPAQGRFVGNVRSIASPEFTNPKRERGRVSHGHLIQKC